jgi:hypothetical protein
MLGENHNLLPSGWKNHNLHIISLSKLLGFKHMKRVQSKILIQYMGESHGLSTTLKYSICETPNIDDCATTPYMAVMIRNGL